MKLPQPRVGPGGEIVNETYVTDINLSLSQSRPMRAKSDWWDESCARALPPEHQPPEGAGTVGRCFADDEKENGNVDDQIVDDCAAHIEAHVRMHGEGGTLGERGGGIGGRGANDKGGISGGGSPTTPSPLFLACGFRKPHSPFEAPLRSWEAHRRAHPEIRLVPREKRRAEFAGRKWWKKISAAGTADLLQFDVEGLTKRGGEELSEEVERHMVRAYLASATYTDENVGKVLAALDKYPALADNTMIVLMARPSMGVLCTGTPCKCGGVE